MQNAEFVVSRLGTCVKMQNQNAEVVQNKTECRIRTEQNRKQNEKIANRIQNQNKTEFSTEKTITIEMIQY